MNADDLKHFVQDLAMSHVECVRAGWDAQQVKISAILAAYDQAVQDPQSRIPSYLMAAIEASR